MNKEFVKPTHLTIDAMPYLQEILGNGIIKDLQENEEICPVCKGTGLQVDDNVYGLRNDPDKSRHFPYKHQSVISCRNCFNGVVRICRHCGKQIVRGYTICKCEGAKLERKNKEDAKEQERLSKIKKLKYDDPIVLELEMFYLEEYPYNNGYFTEWEELFEWVEGDCFDNDDFDPPKYAYPTEKVFFSLDTDSILEQACDDLHEDAYDNLCDIKELDNFLNEWSSKQIGAATYMMNWKYAIEIPWELARD